MGWVGSLCGAIVWAPLCSANKIGLKPTVKIHCNRGKEMAVFCNCSNFAIQSPQWGSCCWWAQQRDASLWEGKWRQLILQFGFLCRATVEEINAQTSDKISRSFFLSQTQQIYFVISTNTFWQNDFASAVLWISHLRWSWSVGRADVEPSGARQRRRH